MVKHEPEPHQGQHLTDQMRTPDAGGGSST